MGGGSDEQGRRQDGLVPAWGILHDLFRMFYPLSNVEQRRWSAMLALPEPEYMGALEREARERGLRQRVLDAAVAWVDPEDRPVMLLFRVTDAGDLGAVRRVHDTIAAHDAPLAYAFVHQQAPAERRASREPADAAG